MTAHALERLAERFPDDDPVDTLERIGTSLETGLGQDIAKGLQGETIREVWLPRARSLFAVIGADGKCRTVLNAGMTTTTEKGVITLERTSLGAGIHQIPEARYHSDPCEKPSLSSTIAKKLALQSPAHAHHAMRHQTYSAAFDTGSAAHALLLGKGAQIIEIPDRLLGKGGAVSTNAAKDFCAEARAAGRTPMTSKEASKVYELAEVMRMFLASCGIQIEPGRTEIVAIGEVDGVMCRAMVDHAPTDPRLPLLDLKTTTDASTDAISRALSKYGYDVQDAHYRETWKAATGEDRDFLFGFVEKEAPHGARMVRLPGIDREMAARKTRRARELWARCQAAQSWPGYPAGTFDVSLPVWDAKSWLDGEEITAAIEKTGRAALDAARRAQAPMKLVSGEA